MNYMPWFIAVAISGVLVWLAWYRSNRQRMIWRVVASVLAGISLVLMLFPPSYNRAIDPGKAILVTEGYHTDSLRNLLARPGAKPILVSYKADNVSKAEATHNLYVLRQKYPGVQKVHLLGYGLGAQELQALEGLQVMPHLSALPEGIIAINWIEQIREGEALQLAGKYKATSSIETKLYLHAAGLAQDSVPISGDSIFNFNLQFTPKQTGRFTYTVVSKIGNQTDTIGYVPVQVRETEKLRILFLASSPQPEFRFLKEHLARQQHQVALRTTISKDISQSEWLNMSQTNLNKLTPMLLQQFDLVITEPMFLQNLGNTERNVLQKAVAEDGLGVLTIADEQAGHRNTAFFTAFPTKRVVQKDIRPARAVWAGAAESVVSAWSYTFLKNDDVISIVEEQGAQLLTVGKRAGWGTVAITAVPQTFSWQLEGEQDMYTSYWAHMLSSVAKKAPLDKFWQLGHQKVPKVNQPLALTYTDYMFTPGQGIPLATVISLNDSVKATIPLAQSALQPEKFAGTFWPSVPGWHMVLADETPPFYFYIQDSANWAFTDIRARQEATRQFVNQQQLKPVKSALVYQEEQVPLIWFFILFVLSSGFLWLEEKL